MAPVHSVPISQSPPLNSVHLILDGTAKEVLPCYIYCQEYYCNWNIKLATDKVEILHNSKVFKVFTTPTRSTFYYAMTYQGRSLVFVIEGRNGWLHGYYGINGMYEIESMAQAEHYMNDLRCRRLPFKDNHQQISGGSTGKTRIGLHALRDAFDAIWKYNGAKDYPEDFKKAFGIIVVHICESMKLRPVFRRICEAFTDQTVTKLGIDGSDFIERLIRSWSYLSGQAMRAIDDTDYQTHNRNVPHISSLQDILTHLAVLFVDGYSLGIFEHDEAMYPCHWEPLERGNGVLSFDDIPYLEKHTDVDNGGSNGDQQDELSVGKQKREGYGKEGRHDEKSKGKRGEEGGRGWGGVDGGGGLGLGRRRGVSLLASGFPLIVRWSVGQGKELPMDQNLNELVMKSQDPVCFYVLTCKPLGMSIMEENEYPWCQLIKNQSLTSLSFYTTNLQQQYLGAVAMTLSGDGLSRTESLKWIGTALLEPEDWYLIGLG